MLLYCGIDLHSNNHVITIIDDQDRRLVEKRVANDLAQTLSVLAPYQDALAGIAIESTFNWYWLVDGLMEAGYLVHLVNTAAVKQYEGLKHSDDKHDAFWLAHLMRLGILPTGYIYPKAERSVRDLLRRRMRLVQVAASHHISLQSQVWRSTGYRVPSAAVRNGSYEPDLPDPHEQLAVTSALRVYRSVQEEVARLEQAALSVMKPKPQFNILQTIGGVGPVLGMTIALETGEIGRFPSVGDYSSYCRCVNSQRLSNGKMKGKGNAKAGNKYLSWAFSEVAHFGLRFEPRAKRFYERKVRQRNGIVAIRALAHKFSRAAYFMMRDQEPFDAEKLFS